MTINFYKQNNVWIFRDVLTPPNTLMMKELTNERVLIMDRARRTRYQGRVDNILDADGNPYENFAALYAATEDFFNDFNEPAVIQLGIDLENGSPTKYLSEKGTMEEIPDAPAPLTNITYEQLAAAITGSTLTPGTQYRITDYSTTTSQPETLSAGHDFDIIVVADSTNKLNENARAVQRAGDTYFDSSKLEAWRLKYSLDNDTIRFAWADTVDGKGVIYEMIDENNNECPYDFKNIMFKRVLTDGNYDPDSGTDTWVYTFTWVDENMDVKDLSIVGQTLTNDEGKLSGIYSNKIKSCLTYGYIDSESMYALNDNVFISNHSYDGGLFYGCYLNTFGYNCRSNTFGNGCNSNTFGNNCYSNTFGNRCFSNTFREECYSNTFGNGCRSNTFGKDCSSNTFGNDCNSNTFGNDCTSNTFGNGCIINTFGNGCRSNTLGNNCTSNTFGNDCSSNTFGNNCYLNTFGANIVFNLIGDSLRNIMAKNGLWGLDDLNKKDWTAVTALYDKNYPIEVWGYRESTNVATTNTFRYFNATGDEVKGTF